MSLRGPSSGSTDQDSILDGLVFVFLSATRCRRLDVLGPVIHFSLLLQSPPPSLSQCDLVGFTHPSQPAYIFPPALPGQALMHHIQVIP